MVGVATSIRHNFPTNITQFFLHFFFLILMPADVSLVLPLDVEHFVAHMTLIIDFMFGLVPLEI
jgi:hypothetical protein